MPFDNLVNCMCTNNCASVGGFLKKYAKTCCPRVGRHQHILGLTVNHSLQRLGPVLFGASSTELIVDLLPRDGTFVTLPSILPTEALATAMEVKKTSSPLLCSLPADLLHQILEYSSSMDDFSAAIQTSKQIYRVYKDRSGSIHRSVACNHMGMTEEIFPLAFSLVLHHERARESELPVKDWLREDEVSASYLNPPRFRKMVSNHDVVRRLEKNFSRR